MRAEGFLAALPVWAVFAATLALVLLSIEAGYLRARAKQRRAEREDRQEKEAPVGAMVGATLGLLAFLLAFTFGLAADAFHDRKVALLAETNAIRAAYLQADLIAEPERGAVRGLLRDYVDERLQWAGVATGTMPRSAQALLEELWRHAAAQGRRDSSDVTAMFLDAVTDVIKLRAERTMLRERSRIPEPFWVVLYLMFVLAFATMGYHAGVAGTTRSPVTVAVAVTFSLLIGVIVDLDRPGQGWINVSQAPVEDLRRELDSAKR